ncbi:MAG TPA: BamA/TamA family outer membrane protein [Firmicutes bacterium]|nr:BamA/TamA family outer membrane protein [Bacillota bacterium]
MVRLKKVLVSIAVMTVMLGMIAVGQVASGAETQGSKIVAIEVQGNSNIPSETILEAVKVKVGDTLSEEKVKADMKAISDLGYFYNVSARTVPHTGGVRLVYEVVENPKLKSITFKGNKMVSTDKLDLLMSVKINDVLNVKKLNGDLERILKYYYNQGYSARISDVSVTPEGEVTISIVEATIGAIKVEGNQKTKTKVITREISVKPGDIFDVNKIREDMRRIYNLGIFENVDVKLDLNKETDSYSVNYIVKERRTGSANLGVAWSSTEGFLGYIDVGDENFLGNHQKVNLRWEFGANKNMYEIGFYEPWLDAKRTSLGFNLYNRRTDIERSWDGEVYTYSVAGDPPEKVKYTEIRRGGDITIGRPLNLDTRLYLTLRIDDTDLRPITEGLGWVNPASGETRSVTVAAVNDTRDNIMNPSSGSRKKLSVELAGGLLGGDYTFGKYQVDGSTYFKTRPDQVLALHLAAGFSSGELPLTEQYKVGGSESIRGYKYGRFYGDKMLYANAEYRFRITKGLQGVLFVDAGNAWVNDEAMDLNSLYTGLGVGVRIDTPIGLLRIDYGTGREGGQTYFSFGQTF